MSALIAALYTGLTFVLAPISFGPVQFRVSEALTLLPFCLPEAVPGLFMAAAWITSKMPNVWLAALPPVVINAVVVGTYIAILSSTPVAWSILYIGASQAAICYAVGVPLILYVKRSGVLEKYR